MTSAVSAFTRSQVVCFIISVSFCLFIALIGDPSLTQTVVSAVPVGMESVVRFINYFSFMDHFFEMTKGIFVLRDVLYFVSVIIVALLVTDIGLRSKRA